MDKILFILHLPPPVHGSSLVGSQIFESDNIKNSFRCRFVNLNTSNSIADIGRIDYLKLLKYVKIVFKVITELIIRKPDFVYIGITSNGIAFYKDAIIVCLCKLFKTKLLFHFNNKGVRAHSGKMYQYQVYKYVFANSGAIVLSDILYHDIKEFFPRNLVEICPYGVFDLAKDGEILELRKSALYDLNRNTILYLGNLIESKGCLVLLEACNILNKRGVEFKCNIVGAEADITMHTLKRLIEDYNLEGKVHFLGKKIGTDKDKLFMEADIFAFPTYYSFEALPIVNIEAMHWGLPVVSTYEGGIPDEIVVNETGFLVEQKNAQDLADKLMLLLENRVLRTEMSIAGRKRFEECYTYPIFEQKMLSILRNLHKKL